MVRLLRDMVSSRTVSPVDRVIVVTPPPCPREVGQGRYERRSRVRLTPDFGARKELRRPKREIDSESVC